MELSSFCCFLLFLVPFMSLCLTNMMGKKRDVVVRLPPGTSGLPIIGETLSIYLKFRKGKMLEFISERVQRYSSSIFRTSVMGMNMVVMSTPEGNKFMFTNEGNLVESWFPLHVNKIFDKSGAQTAHMDGKMIREVLRPLLLKVSGLKDCVGEMNAVVKQHLEAYCKFSKDGDDHVVVKASDLAKRYSVGLVCRLLFQITDLREIEQFVEGLDAVDAAFVAVPINIPGTAWNRGVNASKTMKSRFAREFSKEKNGFLADMVSAKNTNGESMLLDDIAANSVGILFAGYTTAQTTITMLLKALSDHPHVYDSVLQEQREIASLKKAGEGLEWEDFPKMKHSWNAVREILRLHLSGDGFFKEALTDITFEGYTIPKGWKIYWHAQSTQMDPKYFPDPEKFDPSRWDRDVPVPYTFVPFSGGAGICPGHILAKLEVLTFVHYFITRFRWERVDANEKILRTLLPYPAQGLPIRIYRHANI